MAHATNRPRRGPMGHGPGPGAPVEKAKDFQGTIRKILAYMSSYKPALVVVCIFAVASTEDNVKRSFFAGLATLPYLGWAGGTLAGALLGNILPHRLMSALSLAIYGMFVAIVVPEMKRKRTVCIVVLFAAVLSCLFTYVPLLKKVSSGLSISICAIGAAILGALLFPVREDEA